MYEAVVEASVGTVAVLLVVRVPVMPLAYLEVIDLFV